MTNSKKIKFACLLAAPLLVASVPASAFDTGPHQDLTNEAMRDFGMNDQANRVVQLENWLTDYYSNSPTTPNDVKHACEELHFDKLTTTDKVTNYWARFTANTKSAIQYAARDNDSLKLLALTGMSLHAVQDFYTHSNWVETHPVLSGSYYSTTTWFDTTKHEGVRTGNYPNSNPINASEDHGDYDSGINHDSQSRPNFDRAYVFAYAASRQWVSQLRDWANEANPGAWSQAQNISLSQNDAEGLANGLDAAYRVSEWVSGGGNDGHWKGKGSGDLAAFAGASSKWIGSNGGAFVEHFRTNKWPKLLAGGQGDALSLDNASLEAVASPKVKHISIKKKVVLSRTTRLEEDEVGFFESKIDTGGSADLYGLITIGDIRFVENTFQDRSSVDNPWQVYKFVDENTTTVPVRIEVWDEDYGATGDDDHCDIRNGGGNDQELTFDTNSHMISGTINGVFDNENNTFNEVGNRDDDKDRVRIQGFITTRSLDNPNSPPSLSNSVLTFTKNQAISGAQLQGTDDDNDTLTYSTTSTLPAGVTLNSNGSFSGTPTAITSASGTEISVVVSDGRDSKTATVTIKVKEENSLIVTSSGDTTDSFDDVTTLREAITNANADKDASAITFDGAAFSIRKTIALQGRIIISTDVTLTAPATGVILSSASSGPDTVLQVMGGTVLLSGLTVSGNTSSALDLATGVVTITGCTFRGDASSVIFNAAAKTTITNSTFFQNRAAIVAAGGTVNVDSCTFVDNTDAFNLVGGITKANNCLIVGSIKVAGTIGLALDTNNFFGSKDVALLDTAGLQDNGGPAQTIALGSGSPALNSGSTTLTIDGRGKLRPFGVADKGAFEAQNTVPTLGTVTLTPVAPKTGDTLNANFTLSDADSDALKTTYVWKKNDSVLQGESGSSLDLSKAGNGDKGDKITVVVTVTDGKEAGTVSQTAVVTVANSAPVVARVTLSPVAPLNSSTLSATVVASDVDGDGLTYTYVWQKNGTVIEGQTGSILPSSQTEEGDSITVTATANDGTDNSVPVVSSAVSIRNLAPVVESVSPTDGSDIVGARRTFTVTAKDDNGASDIKELWLLVNTRLNWGEGAPFIYVPSTTSPTTGQLFLRKGDAFLPPITIESGVGSASDSLDNGAVRVAGNDVQVSSSGNSITLSVSAIIRDGLLGNNILFGRVQDQAGAVDPASLEGETGYVRFGSYSVTSRFVTPQNSAPILSKLTPSASYTVLTSAGVAPKAQSFGFFAKDENGLSDIESVIFLAGKQRGWKNTATFLFAPRTRRLYLRSDDGSTFLGGGQIGSAGVLENSQVKVNLAQVKFLVYPDGKSMGLSLPLQAKNGLLGQNKIWLRVQDNQGAVAPGSDDQGYVLGGTWEVKAPTTPRPNTKLSAGNS